MKHLAIISNYNGRSPSTIRGKVTEIANGTVHVRLDTGRLFMFRSEHAMESTANVIEGDELELTINRSVQAS